MIQLDEDIKRWNDELDKVRGSINASVDNIKGALISLKDIQTLTDSGANWIDKVRDETKKSVSALSKEIENQLKSLEVLTNMDSLVNTLKTNVDNCVVSYNELNACLNNKPIVPNQTDMNYYEMEKRYEYWKSEKRNKEDNYNRRLNESRSSANEIIRRFDWGKIDNPILNGISKELTSAFSSIENDNSSAKDLIQTKVVNLLEVSDNDINKIIPEDIKDETVFKFKYSLKDKNDEIFLRFSKRSDGGGDFYVPVIGQSYSVNPNESIGDVIKKIKNDLGISDVSINQE